MFQIQSNIVPLHGAVESKQGGRAENQDDFGFADTPLGFLLVVCDGMGGGPGGRTASYIAKCEIIRALCECDRTMQRAAALKMAVSRANDAITDAVRKTPALAGMGATLVAILVSRQSVMVAHVGDSRCYRICGKRTVFCTEDHSLVGELVRKKVLTPEQARTSPQSNVVSRNLGHPVNNIPQIDELPFKKGDRFVLCTDGIWGIMPKEKLEKKLSQPGNVEPLVERLSAEVDRIGFKNGGHHDNHTLAIIRMETDSLLKDKREKRIRVFCLALCAVVAIAALALLIAALHKGSGKNGSGMMSMGGNATGIGAGDGIVDEEMPGDSALPRVRPLSPVLNDSVNVDSIMKARHRTRTDSAKGGKDCETKTKKLEKKEKDSGKPLPPAKTPELLDNVLMELNSMLECKDRSKGKVAEKNKGRLAKVKSLLKKVEKEIREKKLSNVLDFLDRTQKYINDNSAAMQQETAAKDKDGTFYVPTVEARRIISQTRRDVTTLKKKIK